MKKFADLTSNEIKAMSKEEFAAVSPFEKRSCYDCIHLESTLHWWCSNKEAIKVRGTSIPGCIKCSFWKPEWRMIDKQFKTQENGYISLINRIKRFIFS